MALTHGLGLWQTKARETPSAYKHFCKGYKDYLYPRWDLFSSMNDRNAWSRCQHYRSVTSGNPSLHLQPHLQEPRRDPGPCHDWH